MLGDAPPLLSSTHLPLYRPPGNGRGVLTRESDVDFEMRSPNCEFPHVRLSVSFVAVDGPPALFKGGSAPLGQHKY